MESKSTPRNSQTAAGTTSDLTGGQRSGSIFQDRSPTVEDLGLPELGPLVAEHPPSLELARYAVDRRPGQEWSLEEIEAHVLLCTECSELIRGVAAPDGGAPPSWSTWTKRRALLPLAASFVLIALASTMLWNREKSGAPLAATPATATVETLFSDGFESGGLEAWQSAGQPALQPEGRESDPDSASSRLRS